MQAPAKGNERCTSKLDQTQVQTVQNPGWLSPFPGDPTQVLADSKTGTRGHGGPSGSSLHTAEREAPASPASVLTGLRLYSGGALPSQPATCCVQMGMKNPPSGVMTGVQSATARALGLTFLGGRAGRSAVTFRLE